MVPLEPCSTANAHQAWWGAVRASSFRRALLEAGVVAELLNDLRPGKRHGDISVDLCARVDLTEGPVRRRKEFSTMWVL